MYMYVCMYHLRERRKRIRNIQQRRIAIRRRLRNIQEFPYCLALHDDRLDYGQGVVGAPVNEEALIQEREEEKH